MTGPLPVKVEKEWSDHWVATLIFFIVASVTASFIFWWYTRDYEKPKPPGSGNPEVRLENLNKLGKQEVTTWQATNPIRASEQAPAVIDVIPKSQSGSTRGVPLLEVHAGQQVQVVCQQPGWVISKRTEDPFKEMNMWVENVAFNQDSTNVQVDVSPWENSPESFLQPAKDAYLTDDHGFRYDVQRDEGTYPDPDQRQADGTYAGKKRTVKQNEIYRYDLVFGKARPTEFLILHHPQFQNITVWLPWAEKLKPTKLEEHPTQREQGASGGSGRGSASEAPRGSPASASAREADALVEKTEPKPAPCESGFEVAMLTNGFSIRFMKRVDIGTVTRLYLEGTDNSAFVDIPTSEIDHFEKCATN